MNFYAMFCDFGHIIYVHVNHQKYNIAYVPLEPVADYVYIYQT